MQEETNDAGNADRVPVADTLADETVSQLMALTMGGDPDPEAVSRRLGEVVSGALQFVVATQQGGGGTLQGLALVVAKFWSDIAVKARLEGWGQ